MGLGKASLGATWCVQMGVSCSQGVPISAMLPPYRTNICHTARTLMLCERLQISFRPALQKPTADKGGGTFSGGDKLVHMKRQDLLPDELPDLREEVKRLVADPELWLDTPHELLGGRTPNEVITQGDPQHVRDLLRAIKYGVMA